jgi:hypothetical protein
MSVLLQFAANDGATRERHGKRWGWKSRPRIDVHEMPMQLFTSPYITHFSAMAAKRLLHEATSAHGLI